MEIIQNGYIQPKNKQAPSLNKEDVNNLSNKKNKEIITQEMQDLLKKGVNKKDLYKYLEEIKKNQNKYNEYLDEIKKNSNKYNQFKNKFINGLLSIVNKVIFIFKSFISGLNSILSSLKSLLSEANKMLCTFEYALQFTLYILFLTLIVCLIFISFLWPYL